MTSIEGALILRWGIVRKNFMPTFDKNQNKNTIWNHRLSISSIFY
jgi:hypothetical protein